jgi:hypothetical protein
LAITLTVITAALGDTHALVPVPVTEYVVKVAGVTAPTVVVLTLLIEYVLAPVGKILYVKPEQTLPLAAAMVGDTITTTVDTAGVKVLLKQPAAVLPITE